ncbi:hypothetical protein RJ641_017220 [Dillenia turbinata]|uniref:Uncharacterized protein n=1 Tax=Dillenia turbinata TaxID=194707 RepID=A0AAN8Z2Z4_9MAGN
MGSLWVSRDLLNLEISMFLPRCATGDFNAILFCKEEQLGLPLDVWAMQACGQAIEDCDLHDIREIRVLLKAMSSGSSCSLQSKNNTIELSAGNLGCFMFSWTSSYGIATCTTAVCCGLSRTLLSEWLILLERRVPYIFPPNITFNEAVFPEALFNQSKLQRLVSPLMEAMQDDSIRERQMEAAEKLIRFNCSIHNSELHKILIDISLCWQLGRFCSLLVIHRSHHLMGSTS